MRGKVIDQESQKPISQAAVSIQNEVGTIVKNVRTDPSGAFQVSGLWDGRHKVGVKASGYIAIHGQEIAVDRTDSGELILSLERGSSLSGWVLDPEGRPVSGASIIITHIDNVSGHSWGGSGTTDAEGRFHFDGLPPSSNYGYIARHPDFAPAGIEGIALCSKEAREGVEIRLRRGGTLRGRVLDEEGSAISGAEVKIQPEIPEDDEIEKSLASYEDGSGKSGPEGRFEFRHLGGAFYTIEAWTEDRVGGKLDKVAVADGKETEELEIILGKGKAVSGQVVDEEGQPIPGAWINTEDHFAGRSSGRGRSTQSNADGRFCLTGIQAGKLEIYASKAGYDGSSQKVKPPSEGVVLVLPRQAVVSGRIVAEGRETFPDFRIRCLLSDGRWIRDNDITYPQNDNTGHFELELSGGTYILEAEAPGFAVSRSEPIAVQAGERRDGVVIELAPEGILQGVVVLRSSGEPVEGAEVLRRPAAASPWGRERENTDRAGRFTLHHLPAGALDLLIRHEHYPSAQIEGIEIKTGETKVVKLELSPGGSIRGLVRCEGRPLAETTILVNAPIDLERISKSSATDASGRFEISGLPPGEYDLQAIHWTEGAIELWARRKVRVEDSQTARVEVDLEKKGARIFGQITGGVKPEEKLSVLASNWLQLYGSKTVGMDGSGRYSLLVPGAGSYALSVKRGNSEAIFEPKVPEGIQELEIDLELPEGEIAGVVADAETGMEVEYAAVEAFPAGRSFHSPLERGRAMRGSVTTDEEGRFVLSFLPPGRYSLLVSADGYADAWIEGIQLNASNTQREMRLALVPEKKFLVQVLGPKGQALDGVWALLHDSKGGLVRHWPDESCDEDGILVLGGLRPGGYQLTVGHRSLAPARFRFQVPPSPAETSIPVMALKPGGKLKIQISGASGRPSGAAEIEIAGEDGESWAEALEIDGSHPWASEQAMEDGAVLIGPLSPGIYRVALRKGEKRSEAQKVSIAEGQTSEVHLAWPGE